jgi:hypothetical protein
MTEVKFSLGEKVRISAINTPCTIVAIEWSMTGIQYKGVYWVNGERKETWFYPEELQ